MQVQNLSCCRSTWKGDPCTLFVENRLEYFLWLWWKEYSDALRHQTVPLRPSSLWPGLWHPKWSQLWILDWTLAAISDRCYEVMQDDASESGFTFNILRPEEYSSHYFSSQGHTWSLQCQSQYRNHFMPSGCRETVRRRFTVHIASGEFVSPIFNTFSSTSGVQAAATLGVWPGLASVSETETLFAACDSVSLWGIRFLFNLRHYIFGVSTSVHPLRQTAHESSNRHLKLSSWQDKWGKEEAPIVDWDEVKQASRDQIVRVFQTQKTSLFIKLQAFGMWKNFVPYNPFQYMGGMFAVMKEATQFLFFKPQLQQNM